MVERLAEDHRTARRLAGALAELRGVGLDPERVRTNILIFRLDGGPPACQAWLTAAREAGVLCSQLTPETLRLVTHRHIGEAEVDQALRIFRDIAEGVK